MRARNKSLKVCPNEMKRWTWDKDHNAVSLNRPNPNSFIVISLYINLLINLRKFHVIKLSIYNAQFNYNLQTL